MPPRRAMACAAALVCLLTARATADTLDAAPIDALPLTDAPEPPAPLELAPGEILRAETPSILTTDGGSRVRLPPGYFLPDPAWLEIDQAMRGLQDQETRLNAENQSLRASAGAISFGWKTLAGTLVAGLIAGWIAF